MQIVIFDTMHKDVFISIYLDTRRAKANGKYPVKLRLFTSYPRKQMLYPTKFDFSIAEFESIWMTKKTRSEYKSTKFELQEIEKNANDIVDSLETFTFEQFERKFLRNKSDGTNILHHYDQYVNELVKFNQLGTASNYRLSKKSILAFIKASEGKEPKTLLFNEISSNWLKSYENYMVNENGRSYTSVSMYIRALRTLFNKAIQNGDITKDIYPFGKGKYNIPSKSNVKKALNREELGILFRAVPRTKEQEKAKDFWFFSYICNGMNIKDIAQLKWENHKGETIEFIREKTKRTSVSNLKPVTIHLTEYSKGIIELYSNPNKGKDQLIFPFISEGKNELERFNKVKNFTKFINQHMKKLAKENGITGDISTYWARHSFATNAIRLGASMEMVGESLSHSNLKTTQSYFAGFEESQKMDLINKLIDL